MRRGKQKKIALINDFCGFGRCSMTVALPIISALKIQCCPVPTAVFSNHTGFESCYRTDLTAHMAPYIAQWEKLGLEFDGILTGYLGSEAQIGTVKAFLERFKGENTLAVIDPIMGDNGKLYSAFSPRLAEKMGQLVAYADILTPNLTEACILTGTPYRADLGPEDLSEICRKLSSMGPKKIVISGLDRGEALENFLYEGGKAPVVIREQKAGPCRSGTGDAFSAIIAADAVNGRELEYSVRHASGFIAKALRRTQELETPPTDGICFEEFLDSI